MIFDCFRRAYAFRVNFVRTQQNTVKTGTRGTSELSRDKTKATENRSEGTFEAARCSVGARTVHWEGLGASSGRPGDPFGRLLAALGSPGLPQDRLGGGIWVSNGRPERVRTRPRNGLGLPKRLKIDFSSIFGRLRMDFRGFSNDFWSIFARAACDEGTKAESQKGVASSSAHVLALAFCSRFVLLARLSK